MARHEKAEPYDVQWHGTAYRGIGNAKLLERPLTGLLCSRQCPAGIILESCLNFKKWAADSASTVISGFHSPVEQECLRILLGGCASIILFPAREIDHLRIRREWRPALEQDRMLIITLADLHNRNMSRQDTEKRNRHIAELADHLVIPYATYGGQLQKLLTRAPNCATQIAGL